MKIFKHLPFLFISFILILPFIVWKGYYESPKVYMMLIGGLSLSVFWIYRTIIKGHPLVLEKADYIYLLWLLILFISSIFGAHPWESVIGGSSRRQGVIFFLALWLVYKTVQILDLKQKKFLSKGLGIVILAESAIVFIQFALGKLYFGKPLGTLGEANAVAGMIAMGFPFVYINFKSDFFAIPVIAILICESRAGLLSLLTGLIPLFKNFGLILRRLSILVTLILSVLFLLFITSERGSSPFENRNVIWRLGATEILQKPFLGFGAESGEVVFNNAYYKYNLPLSGLIIDRAHNLFLDVAMWSGIIGLAVFCAFLFYRFKSIKEASGKFAFLSFLIYSTFQPLSIVHWLLFFLM